ncbi:MAG TPA: ABC transporter substrate-binding protein [Alphaproteobacteria bacterium]|nr:ABC transporter substrate-binding protein [Alphaproteobacteria bacterium]
MKRRGFLAAAAALAIGAGFSLSPAKADAAGDPKALVQAFYDALVDNMKQGDALGFDGRYKKLEPVIHQTFDIPVMAKIAIGAEWTGFPADKKTGLLEVFDRYMISTYAARFDTEKGLKFEVGEVKTPAENRQLVETKLLRPNGDPVPLNYLFRPSADGSWKIIDIYLSGTISEMARMRSDFSATVTGGGADGLMKALEDKIVEIKNHPN